MTATAVKPLGISRIARGKGHSARIEVTEIERASALGDCHLGSSWLGLRLLVTHDATLRENPCCKR